MLAVLVASAVGCSRDADKPAPAKGDAEERGAAEAEPSPISEQAPAPAAEAPESTVDDSRFVENPTEADVIASSPNYTAAVVTVVEAILAKTKPNVKAEMLVELSSGWKIAAIKRLRAAAGCGLRDAKLAAELLAVRNGVDPGVLRRPAGSAL